MATLNSSRNGANMYRVVKHATKGSALWFQGDCGTGLPIPGRMGHTPNVLLLESVKTVTRCRLIDMTEQFGNLSLSSLSKSSEEDLTKGSTDFGRDRAPPDPASMKLKHSLLATDSGYSTTNSLEHSDLTTSPPTSNPHFDIQKNGLDRPALRDRSPPPTYSAAARSQRPNINLTDCNHNGFRGYCRPLATVEEMSEGATQYGNPSITKESRPRVPQMGRSNYVRSTSNDLCGIGAQFDKVDLLKHVDGVNEVSNPQKSARLVLSNTAVSIKSFSLREPATFLAHHDGMRLSEVVEAQARKRGVHDKSVGSQGSISFNDPREISTKSKFGLQVPLDAHRYRSCTNSSGTAQHGSASGSSNVMPSIDITAASSLSNSFQRARGKRKSTREDDEDGSERNRRRNGPPGVAFYPDGKYRFPCPFHEHNPDYYCNHDENGGCYKTCVNRYESTARIRQHLKEVHHLGPTCHRCFKRFPTLKKLTEHLRLPSGSQAPCPVRFDPEIESCLPGEQRRTNFDKREKRSQHMTPERYMKLLREDLFFPGHQCFLPNCGNDSSTGSQEHDLPEVSETSSDASKYSWVSSSPSVARDRRHRDATGPNNARSTIPDHNLHRGLPQAQQTSVELTSTSSSARVPSLSAAAVPTFVLTTPREDLSFGNMTQGPSMMDAITIPWAPTEMAYSSTGNSLEDTNAILYPTTHAQRGRAIQGTRYDALLNWSPDTTNSSSGTYSNPLALIHTPESYHSNDMFEHGFIGPHHGVSPVVGTSMNLYSQPNNSLFQSSDLGAASSTSNNFAYRNQAAPRKMGHQLFASGNSSGANQNTYNHLNSESVSRANILAPGTLAQSYMNQHRIFSDQPDTFVGHPVTYRGQYNPQTYAPESNRSLRINTNYSQSAEHQSSSGQGSDYEHTSGTDGEFF